MQTRNKLTQLRQHKLDALGKGQKSAYPNDFKPTATGADLLAHLLEKGVEPSPIDEDFPLWRMAGRVIASNRKGKVAFIRLLDRSGCEIERLRSAADDRREEAGQDRREIAFNTFQLFFRRNEDEALFDRLLKSHDEDGVDCPPLLDVGDIVGVTGLPFRTRTGEPSLWVRGQGDEPAVRVLTKALRPLPEKFHGLSDKQTRFRQRYVDLVVNANARRIIERRSKIISTIRRFFEDRDYMEVETPMMHTLIGGAAAKPFKTHHNALDMPLFMRIAPELYLKRLVVGGLERVFEINRNFRNEGISQQHNPEFTMLEFYEAYATFEDLIVLLEELYSKLARDICGSYDLPYGEDEDGNAKMLSFQPPFRRLSVWDGLVEYGGLTADEIHDEARLRQRCAELEIEVADHAPIGKIQMELFEHTAEPHLFQPTFVTGFPVEVSPLSRPNDDDPRLVDRFEMYAGNFELCNAFSELNDPAVQHQRFQEQLDARTKGDAETMDMDLDYIRALEHGLAPTAGCGVGIDRLTMLLTNTQSIREVILFPLLRPERTDSDGGTDPSDGPGE